MLSKWLDRLVQARRRGSTSGYAEKWPCRSPRPHRAAFPCWRLCFRRDGSGSYDSHHPLHDGVLSDQQQRVRRRPITTTASSSSALPSPQPILLARSPSCPRRPGTAWPSRMRAPAAITPPASRAISAALLCEERSSYLSLLTDLGYVMEMNIIASRGIAWGTFDTSFFPNMGRLFLFSYARFERSALGFFAMLKGRDFLRQVRLHVDGGLFKRVSFLRRSQLAVQINGHSPQ